MAGRLVQLGPGLAARIEGEDPLDAYEPAQLAANLAQYLLGVRNHQTDSATFSTRANVERNKAAEMRSLIEQIKERRENPEAVDQKKKSRMDPLDTYDEHALAAQAAAHERNAVKFDQDAQDFLAKAEKDQKLADETSRLIQQVNKHQKKLAEGKG